MNSTKSLKWLIAIAASVAFCAIFTPSTEAQSYNLVTVLNGGTNNVSAATTNTTDYVNTIVGTKATYVALQPSFKLTGAGTSAVVFRFDSSTDASVWHSASHSVSVTAAGTAVVSTVGSVTLGGIGYLRLSSIENPNASALTNLTFKYSTKSGL